MPPGPVLLMVTGAVSAAPPGSSEVPVSFTGLPKAVLAVAENFTVGRSSSALLKICTV